MKVSPALISVLVVITSIVILLAQNLGTVVQISFLGFISLPLPLSLAMLFAFLSGGIAAALWHQVALWLTDRFEQPEDVRNKTPEEELEDDFDEEEYDDDVIEVEYIDR